MDYLQEGFIMNNTQIIRQYEAPISQRQQNLFLEEYYCGTDTRIYIDNNEQTEISGISYNISEQLKPLYGYASRRSEEHTSELQSRI